MPVIFGTGSVESRNQELHPGLPREWQEAKLYSHHLLPPRMCISRKPDQKQRLDFIPGSPTWYAGVPSSGLSHCAAMSITDVIFLYTASYIWNKTVDWWVIYCPGKLRTSPQWYKSANQLAGMKHREWWWMTFSMCNANVVNKTRLKETTWKQNPLISHLARALSSFLMQFQSLEVC